MRKIGGIVPNINAVTNAIPFLQILYVCAITRASTTLKRMGEASLKGAQTNDNVGERLCDFWHVSRVAVSQGFNGNLGVIVLDILCHSVDHAQKCAHVTALKRIDCGTFFTFAVVFVIILRDGNQADRGILFEPIARVFDGGFGHLGVRKTRLQALRTPCNIFHRVHKFACPFHISAIFGIIIFMRVDAVGNAPFKVILAKIKAFLTVFKNGGERLIDLTDLATATGTCNTGSVVVNVEILFQKRVGSVKNTARTATDNRELSGNVDNRISLFVTGIFLNMKINHTLATNHFAACDFLNPRGKNSGGMLRGRRSIANNIVFKSGYTAKQNLFHSSFSFRG